MDCKLNCRTIKNINFFSISLDSAVYVINNLFKRKSCIKTLGPNSRPKPRRGPTLYSPAPDKLPSKLRKKRSKAPGSRTPCRPKMFQAHLCFGTWHSLNLFKSKKTVTIDIFFENWRWEFMDFGADTRNFCDPNGLGRAAWSKICSCAKWFNVMET